jgi:anti-sigma B factor antagonist/stage II sporulation protein AA (anti-sigma F factor antagonist)
MRVHEEQVGDVVVLVPHGDMDLTALSAFEGRVGHLLASGRRALVWDLSAVGMLPSSGAGFLIQAGRRVREAGGRMVLAGLQQRVLGTLRTMGVTGLFRVYPDRAAALAALRGP